MKWTLLVPVLLSTVFCRPQSNKEYGEDSPVEIQKQEIIEIPQENLEQLHGYAELARELPQINENPELNPEFSKKFPNKIVKVNFQEPELPLALPKKRPGNFTGITKYVNTNSKPNDKVKLQGTEKQDLIEISPEDSDSIWFQNSDKLKETLVKPNADVAQNDSSNNSMPKADHSLQRVKPETVNKVPTSKQIKISSEALPNEKSVEEETQRILDNIAAVNKKHGLEPRKRRPDYFNFPHSYSRSHSQNDEYDDFVFPTNPYTNPIFDYIGRQKIKSDVDNKLKMSYEETDPQGNTIIENILSNDENLDEYDETPPGQYIKRKIIHKQTVVVPIVPPNAPQEYSRPVGIPNGPLGSQTSPVWTPNGPIDYRNGPLNGQLEFNNGPIPIYGTPNMLQNGIPIGYQAGIPNIAQVLPQIPFGIPDLSVRGQNYVGPGTYENEHEVALDNQKEARNQTLSNLEKETVNNIKNIVLNSHLPHQQLPPVHLNPYRPPYPYLQYPNPALSYLSNPQINPHPLLNYVNAPYPPNTASYANGYNHHGYNYQLYGPYVVPDIPEQHAEPRQQFQWPWAQFFPIIIKDPMMQLMNAVTSMIEYGPQATCKHGLKIFADNDEFDRDGKKIAGNSKLKYTIKNANTAPEVTIENTDEASQPNVTTLDIEDLVIKTDKSDPKKTTFGFKSLKTETREAKTSADVSAKKVNIRNGTSNLLFKRASTHQLEPKTPTEIPDLDQKRISLFQLPTRSTTTSSTTTPPAWIALDARPILEDMQDEIVEGDVEGYEYQKDVSVSHDGNKKLFSKDNTGSGIFIHKLKVRKGGVAIAGPGGIATAGSGGTAIVGPNGLAYTHPDSLAIAGSGTKVVAVDPSINLGDLISGNFTGKDGTSPRVGKVVAVGPVVYYNKG